MKKVAVIILNWNGSTLLRRYLPTVLAGTNPDLADVIVADNGSTDDSRQVLATEFPQVQVLSFDQNLGFAEGYNQAIGKIDHEYTVLLNSDVRTPDGWLDPLLDYMESHPEVGAVQPKLLHDRHDGKRMFEYAGAAGGFIDKHGYPYCRGRIFEYVEDDHGQYDDGPKSVFWATGACLMVRSQLYHDVGGLDKDFFAHMEEIDLCWRIRLAGSDLHMVPASHVYHLGGGSLPQGNPRKTYLNFRNNLLLLH
ncbi:MAG: glycosyltransferase family 2 protein, partial [Muribaculaceae bacterium]|nr:glycosyltransferase family 2 protein [Muribaculaceae bacterium]